jgi:hypothetical protein
MTLWNVVLLRLFSSLEAYINIKYITLNHKNGENIYFKENWNI